MRVIQGRRGHAGTSAAKGHREEGLEDNLAYEESWDSAA